MKCENLQFNLSLYIDNVLTDDERAATDAHLAQCPLCRQKLDDFRSLRQSLKQFSQVQMPQNLLVSVKTAVRAELAPAVPQRKSYFSKSFREFLQMRVMPLTVGTAASVFFGFSLLWFLLSNVNSRQTAESFPSAPIQIIVPSGSNISESEIAMNDFAAGRGLVSSESPSLNPQGALVAIAQSLVDRKIKEDELVVVADVFSNGLAEIEEVVEPLDDQTTVYELEQAMRKHSADAPFVPAFLDRRADSIRVVLKIQRVDVKVPRTKANQ